VTSLHWNAMIRRNARLRREYLYRKSLEGKERVAYERKRKIRQALEGVSNGCCSRRCMPPRDEQPANSNLPPAPSYRVLTFAEGKPIPTELRRDEEDLRNDIELEDDNTAVPRTHMDDEYAHAGERDPKVFVTTSRDPSSRLIQFAKELKLVFPNSQRVNRGGQVQSPTLGRRRLCSRTHQRKRGFVRLL
jgi:U3 small nucleolar ribonucleoprotein protein IMP4